MKVSILIIICIFFSYALSAQFFSSVPKPKGKVSANTATAKTIAQIAADEAAATVKNEFRPELNILSTGYQINHKGSDTEPGVITMYGAGVGFEHLVWNPTTEKWNIVWSVGIINYLSTHISGKEMGKNWTGIKGGLWDNKINGGVATDFKGNTVITLGIGIPLNNL